MKIACVLLHYRNLSDTLACVDSLRAAHVRDWKIFLVNNSAEDGSGPALEEALASLGSTYALIDPGFNTGFAGGCNLGIRAALREDFSHVILLNNDTIVAPDFFDETLRRTAAHPGEILAGLVLEAETGKTDHNIGRISPLTGRVRHFCPRDYRGEIDFISGCLMIIPREALEAAGGFDENLFMYAEDLDLCMRFRKAGFRMRYAPSIVVRHKFSAAAKTSGLPKEYYIQRNQTYVILRRGTPVQRLFYVLSLVVLPLYKAIRHPRLFRQAMAGVWDGLWGTLGRTRRPF